MQTAHLSTKIGLGRKILYVLILALSCVLILEIVARLSAPDHPWLNARYVELSKDYEHLEDLVDDVGWGPGTPPKYYDEFLYSASPLTSTHLNYTDYYSSRFTPASVPLSEATEIVWAFGGSTLENSETTDSLTIANIWARLLNRFRGPTHVKNFGTGGFFSSYEMIKFQRLLREVPNDELPTIAIFFDGYNDTVNGFQYGAGHLQRDLSLKLRALVERRRYALWAYATSEILARWSVLWSRTAKRIVDHVLFPMGEPNRGAQNLSDAIRIYVSNVKMLRGACDALEIRCFFVLQPLLVTKRPLSPPEQEVLESLIAHPRFGMDGVTFVRTFYAHVAEQLAYEEGFIDASGVLDGRVHADFYDIGHVGALSPPIIGERVGSMILDRLSVASD